MDESFPLPGCEAELNWKLLFIPPVSRRRIRFVCNWFKPGGSFVEERLRFSSWWKRWLNLFCLACLRRLLSSPCFACVSKSDHPSPLSTRAPCWAVKVNLQTCSLIFYSFPSLSLSFFFLAHHFSEVLIDTLSFSLSSSSSFKKKALSLGFHSLQLQRALMRWWILSQGGDVSHCLSNPLPHLTVIEFGPWLRGACQPDFLCRKADRVWGLPVGKWLQSHYSSSKALPGPVRHSPSAAVHLCSHSSLGLNAAERQKGARHSGPPLARP